MAEYRVTIILNVVTDAELPTVSVSGTMADVERAVDSQMRAVPEPDVDENKSRASFSIERVK